MLPCELELEQIVSMVWTTMFGIDAECVAPSAGQAAEPSLSASVSITGAFEGQVQLSCPVSLAQELASTVYGQRGASLGMELVADLVGELSNIVAGNLQALLPEGCHVGLPQVCDGADAEPAGGEGRLVSRAAFRSGDHVFAVRLLKTAGLALETSR